MVGYCIVFGILFLFLFGSASLICDAIFNKEEEIVIRKQKPQPETDLAHFVSDDYDIDDELFN